MAKLFYDTISGGTILVQYDDGQQIQKIDLEAARDDLVEIQALSSGLREDMAQQGFTVSAGISIPAFTNQDPEQPTLTQLELFDARVQEELDIILDKLDYFDYAKGAPPIGNVVLDDYFLPEAVEDVSDELVGSEAVLAIDAVNGGDPDPNDPLNTTYWQSEISGLRVITFRIRSYTKRVEGIRLRTNNGDGRAQLQNLTVKAANMLGQIDAPGNVMASGINLDDAAGWFDIPFMKPGARYIRLEASTSAHTNPDHLRIRSIQVRVGVTNHDK